MKVVVKYDLMALLTAVEEFYEDEDISEESDEFTDAVPTLRYNQLNNKAKVTVADELLSSANNIKQTSNYR